MEIDLVGAGQLRSELPLEPGNPKSSFPPGDIRTPQ
jgi:hypothetical protein